MVLISKYLVPKGYTGLTIFPFVFLKRSSLKQDVVLINHENIHLRQQIEMLILPFFIWYGIEYVIGLLKYRSHFLAYKNISFEREAYINHGNLNYLKTRKFWQFLRYF